MARLAAGTRPSSNGFCGNTIDGDQHVELHMLQYHSESFRWYGTGVTTTQRPKKLRCPQWSSLKTCGEPLRWYGTGDTGVTTTQRPKAAAAAQQQEPKAKFTDY
jgi:hypothetical protein